MGWTSAKSPSAAPNNFFCFLEISLLRVHASQFSSSQGMTYKAAARGLKVADFSWFGAGPFAPRTSRASAPPSCASSRRRTSTGCARRAVPGRQDWLQRLRLLQQLQRRQARRHPQHEHRAGPGDGAQAHRLVRRLHHQHHEPHGRPLGPQLRRAGEDQPDDHRRLPADAGVRWPAPRLLRLRRRAQRRSPATTSCRLPEPPADRRRHELPRLRDQPRPHARSRSSRRCATARRPARASASNWRRSSPSSRPSGPPSWTTTRTAASRPRGQPLPYAAPHGAFRCLRRPDGSASGWRWVAFGVFNDVQWSALVAAMDAPEWAARREFATLDGRKENEDEIEANVTRGRASARPRT